MFGFFTIYHNGEFRKIQTRSLKKIKYYFVLKLHLLPKFKNFCDEKWIILILSCSYLHLLVSQQPKTVSHQYISSLHCFHYILHSIFWWLFLWKQSTNNCKAKRNYKTLSGMSVTTHKTQKYWFKAQWTKIKGWKVASLAAGVWVDWNPSWENL